MPSRTKDCHRGPLFVCEQSPNRIIFNWNSAQIYTHLEEVPFTKITGYQQSYNLYKHMSQHFQEIYCHRLCRPCWSHWPLSTVACLSWVASGGLRPPLPPSGHRYLAAAGAASDLILERLRRPMGGRCYPIGEERPRSGKPGEIMRHN